MKNFILLNALLFVAVFGLKAQPFQQSFTNVFGYSCDHYSIETFDAGGIASYAVAGTFFTGSQTIMHVFTLDVNGSLVWENYIDLGLYVDARALDVAIGPNYSVAITGYIENSSGPQLYAAWYDNSGTLINDFWYYGTNNTSGNNIIYSAVNDQFIIGGFETGGNALLVALDGSFNMQWENSYNAQCDGFNTAVINEITEVNGNYFITGKLAGASSPYPYGQSQVLAAIVDNASGSILSNATFEATNTLGGQQAMGVSSYFDATNQTLALLYNVSVSPTGDETRPYVDLYKISSGTNLNYGFTYRIDNVPTNPSSFVGTPNFTGLKLIYNSINDTYIIFGMLEEYGPSSDRVISGYQEIDLNSGTIVTYAKDWSQSEIPTGYPAQGGLYSLFDPSILNAAVYTPETTTLSSDNQHFVSILPTPGTGSGNFSFDVISSTLNTTNASSPCIDDFKLTLAHHTIASTLCLQQITPSSVITVPMNTETPTNSSQVTSCVINQRPENTGSGSELSGQAVNELMIQTNPAENLLQYSITETGNYNVVVMNTEGKILISTTVENTTDPERINIDQLAAGVYILIATDANGQKIQKRFIKQ